MSDLDDRLREIIEIVHTDCKLVRPCLVENQSIRAIKEAFAEEGWITPEQVAKTQELVNQMANLAQDMAKLSVTVERIGTMTGREWHDKFRDEMPRAVDELLPLIGYERKVVEAAKRAAGLEDANDNQSSQENK